MAKPTPSPTAVFDNYAEAFAGEVGVDKIGPQGASVKVNPGVDTKRDRLIRECYRRIAKQGWENATLVSVLTFPLDLNMGYGGHLTVPAKKVGTPYIIKVLDMPYIDPQDEGDGKIVPVPVFPTEMAEDMEREYITTGGVFWYPGNQPLSEYVDKRTGKTGLQLLEEANERVLTWYEVLYKDAQDEWAREPRHRNITDRMRDAAKELFRLGIISELPTWTKVSKEESPNTNCEACGSPVAKVAKFCPQCHFMFDPGWMKNNMPHIWLEHNTDLVTELIKREKAGEFDNDTDKPPVMTATLPTTKPPKVRP